MNISVNPYLMAVVFVVFVLLLWAMNVWVYRPLLAFMDNRQAEIKDSLAKIKTDNTQSVEIRHQIDALLKEAAEKRREMIAEAIQKAIESYDAVIKQKENELNQEFEAFAKQLQNEKQILKEQLQAQMPVFENELNKRVAMGLGS
ncbi:FoF1 ATP synthase subunit B' [Helicobacter pylori]|uniref:FoF1 ATP synthase subunit B' n=1 Tax=Helicobacter pylori TaxID=210 RepID=UPI000957D9CF|nr:FoF1 ATP synthase subunit B' [Helicobacter pylori]BAW62941.1 F0F1 ATP synthase subunit B' [Helicobacter pylori]BDO45125.1 F0F1 ATP synthase subunit B', AtpXF' [Helicobacter pylori]BDO46939.1 F0F1 ATP synthase subunit B', AtpXF' [Helicobacter pylori]GHQ45129.1 F0F1 ATP synthase subunit B' [Helicobacter pylori]GHR48141.1 F0F1 ATP synthase subunit B' [Helicobacter pylori]